MENVPSTIDNAPSEEGGIGFWSVGAKLTLVGPELRAQVQVRSAFSSVRTKAARLGETVRQE